MAPEPMPVLISVSVADVKNSHIGGFGWTPVNEALHDNEQLVIGDDTAAHIRCNAVGIRICAEIQFANFKTGL